MSETTARDWIALLRPAQWIKNVFLFAGLLFGGRALMEAGRFGQAIGLACAGFIAFCLASSACYICNDVLDAEQDRLHPAKRFRPLARGVIPVNRALTVAAGLLALAVVVSLLLPPTFLLTLLSYVALIGVYSLWAKRQMILDVVFIAAGFVLRALAGAVAVDVVVSPWLIVCTFTLCLFLGFGKRRCELAVMANREDAVQHRATLEHYTPELLSHYLSIAAAVAILTFLLYTMETTPPAPFPKQYLMYTLPLVVYGVFRFGVVIESGRVTGPVDVILRDRPFQITLVLWTIAAVVIVFGGNGLRNYLTGG